MKIKAYCMSICNRLTILKTHSPSFKQTTLPYWFKNTQISWHCPFKGRFVEKTHRRTLPECEGWAWEERFRLFPIWRSSHWILRRLSPWMPNRVSCLRLSPIWKLFRSLPTMIAVPDDTLTLIAAHEYTRHDSCEGTSQPCGGCQETY